MQVTNGGLSRPRQGTGHVLSPLDNSPPLGGSIDGRLRGTIQSAPAPQQPPRTQHSQIAIQFVKDFYLTLASQGESVWPYYHENDSVLSRPEESQASNDNSNVTGQLPIYRTLASLGLKNSRYKINTVDSQPSVDGGVHLLVTGLVQGTASRLETPRTFAQSFHLARTKDGASYYIRNDILRIVGAVPQSPRPQPTTQPQPTPQQAQPQQPQQTQPQQPQQTQTQPTATLPVQRPRAIPSTTQLNQLSVSLSNSSPSTPSLSSQPLKAKKDFYDQKDDSYDQIVISSSTTHSISQTLNNTTAIPDKIITHSPPVQVSTAVSSIPSTISQQQATTNKLKWGDREPKYEEDDEEDEDYDGKGYEYEQVKEEKWRKKTPQPQTSQPQTSQPQQTTQPQQTAQPQTQPTQTQPQRSTTTQPQQQTQPQSPQQSVKPVQPVQPVQQPTPPQSTKSVAPAPQRQVPVKPAGQTQPAQQAQVQVTQQPQVQQAQIQQPQPTQQAQPTQPTQQASKQQTAPVKQAVKAQSPPAQAPAQGQQAQSQGQQVQGQQAKSQGQQKPVLKASQPKKIDVETYAGRIGIRPDNNTYYRQPKPLKPITTEEYRPKEGRKEKDGGRGRGQGGQGGQGGRGGGRGGQAGNAEFRPRTQEPTPSLFVSGIPEDADENSVAEHFKHFGTVKGVDFPSDKNFCFVHFESQEGVDNAMATEEELEWDGFSIWYEPKRLPAPRAPRGVGAGGAGRGGGGGKNTTSAPKETKQDTATGNANSGGKAQQPQKQQPKQSQKQPQKQRTHSQSQGQDPADDQQGAWKKVEHRNNRRKQQQTAEKKGDKKTEKKGERK